MQVQTPARDKPNSATVSWLKTTVALDIPVRFAETDLMGVVHHSVYALWLEAGRVAWLDAAGISYPEIAAGGNHFAVTGLYVKYRTPARFGEEVRVATRIQSLRSREVSFAYEVLNTKDGTVLATGVSEHICVDLAGRVTRIPPGVIERMRAGAEMLAQR